MKKNLLKLSLCIVFLLVVISPMVVFAQPTDTPATPAADTQSTNDSCSDLQDIGNIICKIHNILGLIVPLLLSLGLVYFIWGVLQYVIKDGDEAKKKGKDRMIYGIIGLAAIVGIWGIVNIITTTFGVGGAKAPTLSPLTGTSSTCDLSGKPKLQNLLCYVTRIINDSVIPLIFALAMVMFIWGVVQYVINSDEEAKKAKGKQFMLWGIIALTVMVSVWGLVGILSSTFGIEKTVLPQVKP